MKRGLRIFGVLAKLLLGSLAVVLVALLTVFMKPNLIGQKRLVSIAQWGAGQAGVFLHWGKTPYLSITSATFLTKRVELHADGLCLHLSPDIVDACFKQFRVDVELKVQIGAPELVRVREFTVMEGRARVNLASEWVSEEASETQGESERPNNALPALFELLTSARVVKIDKLGVGMKNVSLLTKDSKIRGAFSAELKQATTLAVQVDGTFEEKGKTTKLGANIQLAFNEAETLPWSLKASAEGFGYSANTSVEAQVTANSVNARLRAYAKGGRLPFTSVALKDCTANWVGNESRSQTNFSLNCPVEGVLARKYFVSESDVLHTQHSLNWNRLLALGLAAELRTAGSDVEGGVSVKLAAVKTSLFAASANVDFEVQGKTKDLLRFYEMPSTVNAQVDIPEFQRFVDWVEQAKWAIPGPLNALRGQIKADVTGGGRFLAGESKVPFIVKTALKSNEQKLNIDADGSVLFRPVDRKLKTHLELNLALSEVRLVLPPLDVTRPTRFFPDSRIEYTEVKGAPASDSFSYKIHIHTPKPAMLLSNISKEPIPVSIELNLGSGEQVRGSIQVASFPANLFRKRATLEYFKLIMAGKKDAAARIDGSVRVEYTDYSVVLRVHGTVEEPRLILESEPPLPEEDVVSVLLFGKPASELSSDEGDTAANARAAMANRSISLASMYLLASTPIESIGFNPMTGALQAKIRLDDKTSVTVQSDRKGGHQALGLRRRIGSWSIQTYIEDSEAVQSDKTVSAFLEWSKRY